MFELNHCKNNNETYISHMIFASKVGLTMLFIGTVFVFHALLPFFKIPKKLNLEHTIYKMKKWNMHTIRRKK